MMPKSKQPSVSVKWTPPENPNQQEILSEAQGDAIAGRYEEALTKHVWFHENALKIDSAFYGVRLSFALSYWQQLGIVYPAAKNKLIEIRNEAEARVLKGKNARDAFHEFESINTNLGQEKKTVTLFKNIANSTPELASEIFDIAQPALIKAGEYQLCSKHVDPKDYARVVKSYREDMHLAEDPQFGERHADFAHSNFENEVVTLVSLLSLSERKPEAEEIAVKAKDAWKDESFADQLDAALEGQVPAPWP